jgi:hypothetical protein
VIRIVVVCGACALVAGCVHDAANTPRGASRLELHETVIDDHTGDVHHVEYVLKRVGEDRVVFAVRAEGKKPMGFSGVQHLTSNDVQFELAARDGLEMTLTCKVESVPVHATSATFVQRIDKKCQDRLSWSDAAARSVEVLACEQRDTGETAGAGLFWHAGTIRLAPGVGIESIVNLCSDDEIGSWNAGYRAIVE